MEFNIGVGTLSLPSLPITISIILIMVLLVRWSRQLETRHFTVYFYFLISTFTGPIYTRSTEHSHFELWIPLGFFATAFYLYRNPRSHPSKVKASLLGLCVAIYHMVQIYAG